MGTYLLMTLCVHFVVTFVAFPFGGVTVQNLRHVLGDGLGKGDGRSPNSAKHHTLEKWKEMKDQMELAVPWYEPLCHEGKGFSAQERPRWGHGNVCAATSRQC